MKFKTIPSKWINEAGLRLDCSPYLAGGIEAKEILEEIKFKKELLVNLSKGGMNGILNVGRIKRLWANDFENGIPFLSGREIIRADLTDLYFISKSVVQENPKLLLQSGWTLITRSGSIGKTAYARQEMAGKACTEDVLRVIPDESKVHSGYLYAFLSCKYGIPQIVSSTYGAIIPHIEPQHVAKLSVPRIGTNQELKIHKMIQEASELLSKASLIIANQTEYLENDMCKNAKSWEYKYPQAFAVGPIPFSDLNLRFDPFHHIGYVKEALTNSVKQFDELYQHADVLRPPQMKRLRVEQNGIEFLDGADLHTVSQKSTVSISKGTKQIASYVVKKGMVLFQCVGQRYGLFARPILVNDTINNKAVTEAVMRVIPHSADDAGYLYIYFKTEIGRRMCMQYSAGSSIPVLQEAGAKRIKVYWPNKETRTKISNAANEAWEYRAKGIMLENLARACIEEIIEKA